MPEIDFRTEPALYRHWRLEFHGPVAHLVMDVDANARLFEGYELKLNSYDLGVDIELADAIQRLRFEHPEVGAVVLRSGKDNVFCAGANIRMLGKASHGHKVNFCKFTNETRCAIEDATEHSRQTWLCAVNGPAAGGGYELAVACEHIMLIDDRRSSVALPETPLLAVLPGTGGLTRVTDKRRVRRDLADVFCSVEEGVRGKRAVEWRLVDEVVPPSAWERRVAERAAELAARSDRPRDARGVAMTPLERSRDGDTIRWSTVTAELDRAGRRATITVHGPASAPPATLEAAKDAGFWPLRMARELDDAILHLRLNEPELGLWLLKTEGDAAQVLAHDAFLETHATDWFIREVRLYLKRLFKRVDVTSRSLVALLEPGSCFAGTLAELAFAADRGIMLIGTRGGDNRPPARLTLSPLNFGAYPMANGLTRLQARFYGEPESVGTAQARIGEAIEAEEAEALGLVTIAYDETDWDDEVRILLEERASFSPDALTGMEANLRFVGPETMETRIFGRLTAWQNWIFQRSNSVGETGALKLYGTGIQPTFDRARV
ncbi:2,3-epoxybenzoyl-CoA dihydrolase [Paracraurococcus lichenis]|uniref:2,3-epoxybenzoyl-CoA dihydrolase n=1 Tax=Paracraurococcus lichenis TaxID=3064888 RepID=A0ABT9DW36_9PROT|nr:2,3-epoxybenzoyl-CoA dihydrolase [Paracraurococcus sp. LOR1-02]MDO9708115.1 2,3-epoxybenzoyl-CoA dihydrolase [Paracraurococcus sp. LOR1-02]